MTYYKSKFSLYLRLLWMLAFLSGLTFETQNILIIKENPIQLTFIHKIISHILLILFLMPFIFKKMNILIKGIYQPFILYSLWCFLSAIWSVYPIWTAYRAIEYFIILTLVAYTSTILNQLEDLKNWINFVWGFVFILVITVFVGILIFPSEALVPSRGIIPFMISGVYPRLNPNTISHIGGILGLVGFSRVMKEKKRRWLIFIFTGVSAMLLSQGRSGIIAFLVGLISLFIMHKRIKILSGVLLVVTILWINTQFDRYILDFFHRGQTTEQLLNLGGRTDKWNFALEYIRERPFLGYGAFAGARFFVMPEIGEELSSSTHNAFIEITVDTGIIGLFLFCLGLLRILKQFLISEIKLQTFNSLEKEVFSILILLIVRGIFTTATLISPYDYSFLVSIGMAEYLRRNERKTKNKTFA